MVVHRFLEEVHVADDSDKLFVVTRQPLLRVRFVSELPDQSFEFVGLFYMR